MIGPIQAQYVRAPNAPFNERAGTATRVIGVVALSIIGAFVSFAFLPWQAAFLVSGGLTALVSMLCCRQGDEVRRDDGQPHRWFHPIINAMPGFVRNMGFGGFPVVQPGPRVFVGGQPHFNVQPPDPRPVVFAQPPVEQPHVHPGHRHGVAVLPPIPGAPAAPHHANPAARVAVGAENHRRRG